MKKPYWPYHSASRSIETDNFRLNLLFQWIEEVFVKYFDEDKVIVLFELDIYFIYLVIPFWYKAAEENVIADSGNTLVSLIFNFGELLICNFYSKEFYSLDFVKNFKKKN